MRKIVLLLLIVLLMLSVIAADKPPKPPKVMSLMVINRAGEDVRVSLTGLGYDFATRTFIDGWGVIQPQFYSIVVPGSRKILLPDNTTLVIKLPEYTKRMDVLRDLYILNIQYEREFIPKGSNAGGVICLNNYLPVSMYGDPAYFAVRYANSKLVIRPCNSIPVNIGVPSEGVVKYNKLMLILEFPGYYGYPWK